MSRTAIPRNQRRLVVVSSVEPRSWLAGPRLTPGGPRQEWIVDDVRREALVHTPVESATDASPLAFVFHGHGGSSRQAARSIRIHEEWPEAIVIYPQGLNTPGRLTDPTGKRSGWQHDIGDQKDRDLKFCQSGWCMLYESKVDAPVVTCVYPGGHRFPAEAPALIVTFFKQSEESPKARTAPE